MTDQEAALERARRKTADLHRAAASLLRARTLDELRQVMSAEVLDVFGATRGLMVERRPAD